MERDVSFGHLIIIVLTILYFWLVGMLHLYKEFKSEIYSLFYNFKEKIYIPAVVGINEGEITTFYLKVGKGVGKIYFGSPPVMDPTAITGMLFAKSVACKLFKDCDNYDYYITTNDVSYGKGPSGSAGIFLMLYSFLSNQSPVVNYPITGFILPNGIVGAVGGLEEKLNATLKYGFSYLVAPAEGKNIIPAYTFLDLLKIYFKVDVKVSEDFPEIPKYNEIMREIATEFCSNVTNESILKYLKEGEYYTAASLCFIEKSSKHFVNVSEEKLNSGILDFMKKIQKISCFTYECEEIKYQVLRRLKTALSLNNTTKKYWRYKTAVGWSKFLKYANKIDRKDTCKQVMDDYDLIKLFYEVNGRYVKSTSNCFDARENATVLLYPFVKVDSKKSFESIKNLVLYYLNRNGFSITAYSYLQYSEYWASINDWKNAKYYLLLALEYAI